VHNYNQSIDVCVQPACTTNKAERKTTRKEKKKIDTAYKPTDQPHQQCSLRFRASGGTFCVMPSWLLWMAESWPLSLFPPLYTVTAGLLSPVTGNKEK
jgi:hypothetical protein